MILDYIASDQHLEIAWFGVMLIVMLCWSQKYKHLTYYKRCYLECLRIALLLGVMLHEMDVLNTPRSIGRTKCFRDYLSYLTVNKRYIITIFPSRISRKDSEDSEFKRWNEKQAKAQPSPYKKSWTS